jgi:putative addiction module antidote
MTESLTIRQIGNSSGVVLPKDVLERMNVQRGDQLYITYTPDGIVLRPFDETFARQMEIARQVMRDDREILRELAK